MEFYYQGTDNDALILTADGGLTRDTAAQFVSELSTLAQSGIDRIIVDCTKLTYISLSGLSVLLGLPRMLARQGADLKLAAVHGLIASFVAKTWFAGVFRFYKDVGRARLAGHSSGTRL